MGLFLGSAVVPAMVVALACGATVGVALMLRDGLPPANSAIPFGPFLALGAVVGLLAGARDRRLVPRLIRRLAGPGRSI